MLDKTLGFIAPHHCFSCDKIGGVLCASCKKDIISDNEMTCIGCGCLTIAGAVCTRCNLGYTRGWIVGRYHSPLGHMIRSMKAEGVREVAVYLAELLSLSLPSLPDAVRIVPIPTVPAHRRTRGFDHTQLMANELSRRTGRRVDACIGRRQNTTQRGKGRTERLCQAREAFTVRRPIDPEAVYLLIDDVVTTGASVSAAARCLRQAGATTVWMAAIAHEVLDESPRI